MAGYSGTPLLRKLGIQTDHRVLLQNAPAKLPEELKDCASARPRKNVDVVLFFVQSAAALDADLVTLLNAIQPDGMIWIA